MEINFEDRLDLNREEERVLSAILHPFGDLTIVSSSNLPKWSRNLISKIQIPHIQELQPPNVKIVDLRNNILWILLKRHSIGFQKQSFLFSAK